MWTLVFAPTKSNMNPNTYQCLVLQFLYIFSDVVIARIEDEVTVKYFQRSAPNIVHLKPANEEFSDIEVNLEETELYIEGKSVGLIREN